jgi:hypothetical protein
MMKFSTLVRRTGLAAAIALCGALAPQLGCAVDDGDAPDQTSQSSDNLAAPKAAPKTAIDVASFWETCRDESWHSDDGRGIVRADAESCQRKNGSWGGPTSYRGYCDTNLSNLNGVLHCQ